MPNSDIIVQSPVNLVVRPTVIRAGSYQAGYQIINRDLQATVWASDSPSVSDGHGIPVNAGTSITWTSDGDLYLVLGTDALSVQSGSAAVVITYTTSDYNPSPAAIAVAILNSGQLVNSRQQLLSSGVLVDGFGTVITLDVSTYASVYLEVLNPLGGLPGAGVIDVGWYPTNPLSSPDFAKYQQAVDSIGYINGSTIPIGTGGPRQTFQFPVRAPWLQIGGYGGGLQVDVIGSTTPCPGNTPRAMNPLTVLGGTAAETGDRGALGVFISAALGVGAATAALVTPPWFGDIEIHTNIGSGSTDAYLNMVGLAGNNNTHSERISLKPGTDGAFTANVTNFNRKRFYCNGSEVSFALTNLAGVAAIPQFIIVPCDPR